MLSVLFVDIVVLMAASSLLLWLCSGPSDTALVAWHVVTWRQGQGRSHAARDGGWNAWMCQCQPVTDNKKRSTNSAIMVRVADCGGC